MKQLIVFSMLLAVMLLATGISTPTHAQSPTTDLKPTFMSPTPGLYVNGWPAFTVSYSKEWVELPLRIGPVFRAGVARPDLPPAPELRIAVFPFPFPLEEWAKMIMPMYAMFATDIKVLSDKPSQLRDGTPAREVEFECVVTRDPNLGSFKNGPKMNTLVLVTKREPTSVWILLNDDKGRISEDLKRIAYSLTFLPGKDEPAKIPPDVRAFLDMYCADLVDHDVETILAHFSDHFLQSGVGKGRPGMEQFFPNDPISPFQRGLISCEATVTVFELRGDKAYLDGFVLEKAKGDANALKIPMAFQQIINEHGEWKWYGNHK